MYKVARIEVWVRNELKWRILQCNTVNKFWGRMLKMDFFVKTKFIFTERDFVSLVYYHNICETYVANL